MSRLAVALAALVFSVALVGCGGSSQPNASGETSTTTATTEQTSTETTGSESTLTEATSTETSGANVAGVLGSKDCLALVSASAALGQAIGGTSGGSDASAQFAQLADKVPDSIKADFSTLADAYSTYAKAVKNIGLQPGQVPSASQMQQYQQAVAAIDQQAVQTASKNITAWTNTNCKS